MADLANLLKFFCTNIISIKLVVGLSKKRSPKRLLKFRPPQILYLLYETVFTLGKDAVYYASENSHMKCTELLLYHGADSNQLQKTGN